MNLYFILKFKTIKYMKLINNITFYVNIFIYKFFFLFYSKKFKPYLDQIQRVNYYIKNLSREEIYSNKIIKKLKVKKLKKKLYYFNISKKILNKNVIEILFDLLNSYKINNNINNYKIERILDSDNFNYYELNELYNLSKKLGLYSVALAFRNRANLNLINLKNSHLPKYLQIRKVGIYLENNNYEKCLNQITEIEDNKKNKDRLIEFVNMSFNKYKNLKSPIIEGREKFYEFVRNKNLSLIASANYKNSILDLNIDKKEIIVKFGYRENENKECNISFYNHGQVQHILKNKLNFPSNLDWIVVRNEEIFDLLKNRDDCKEKITFLNQIPLNIFDGILQNLQRSIVFLSNFKIKKISVFNTDFHQSLNRSKDSMTLNSYLLDDPEKYLYRKISVQHDPISAKRIMTTFNQAKLINPDKRLSKILNQSDFEFMKILENVYKPN